MSKQITVEDFMAFTEDKSNAEKVLAPLVEREKKLLTEIAELTADLRTELTAVVTQREKVERQFGVEPVKSAKKKNGKNGKIVDMKYNAEPDTVTFGRSEKPGKEYSVSLADMEWQKKLTAELQKDGINGETGGTIRGIINRIRQISGQAGF